MKAHLSALFLFFACQNISADEIRIAVASNFKTTLEALVRDFESHHDHQLIIASGSTGKHYAQIINGAPFDLFFAADVRRPELLEQQQRIVPGSRFTYAFGKLVLWSPQSDYVDANGDVLTRGEYRHLAMANPRLAPYGLAAKQVLQHRGLYQQLQPRLVRGENIGQAYQYVATGNAELGFVASSQIHSPGKPIQGSWWVVPPGLYDPIKQQAVQLTDRQAVRNFLTYIKGDKARRIIQSFGYAIDKIEAE
jgi:molybdate transport system substrate-binding protein